MLYFKEKVSVLDGAIVELGLYHVTKEKSTSPKLAPNKALFIVQLKKMHRVQQNIACSRKLELVVEVGGGKHVAKYAVDLQSFF